MSATERQIVDRALAVIRDRFESGHVPDHMHYHNSVHTAGVVARARAIGHAMDLDERDLLLTTIAAAYHDTVQTWHRVVQEGGAMMRQRHTGRDEVASAHEATQAMADLDERFTVAEFGIVASAIIGTIPGWDNDAHTVSQPFLIDHPVIRAVALGDLGAAGMDPDMYRRDGPALFAEENLDLMEALAVARRAAEIPAEHRRLYRERYVSWLRIQPGFARGRRQRLLNGELSGLSEKVEARLLALFSRFEESVAAAEAAIEAAESIDFVLLMRQLNPVAFPDEP